MRQCIVLTVLTMLFAARAAAEKTSTFLFDSTESYHYYSAYRYVQVIDNRRNKENLGTLRGKLGRSITMLAESSLEQQVNRFWLQADKRREVCRR